jgi:phosphoribosylaminoimidazole (AIR) synthetase
MIVITTEDDADALLAHLADRGSHAWRLGRIETASGDPFVAFE